MLGVVKETVSFQLKGGIPRLALVYSNSTPNGQVLPLDFFKNPDDIAPALRGMCRVLDAWGLIQVSEAWALELSKDMSREAAREEYAKWAGKLEEHPDVIEQALVVWEYKRTQGTSMAKIIEKDGVRSLEPWFDASGVPEGRLVGLLPGARGN